VIVKNANTGEYTVEPKYRVGDYVEWESPLGIYVGMIRSFNYQHSVSQGVRTWYEINQQEVPEDGILCRLIKESNGNPEQQELTE